MTYRELQENTPIEEQRYYVYMFLEEVDGKLTPFYVGKGTGNRANIKSGRSKTLTEYMQGKTVKTIICAKDLCDEYALAVEKRFKEELARQGFKLIDGEHNKDERKRRREEGIAAMPIIDGKRTSMLTGNPMGRPANDYPEFSKFLEKTKKGEMSISECCRQLGISRTHWYRLCK